MIAIRRPTAREAALQARLDLVTANLHAVLRIARDRLGDQPLPFTDEERRFIAECAAKVGWKALVGTLLAVSVGTLRRWHRRLVVGTTGAVRPTRKRRPGRPPIPPLVRKRVVKVARRNPTWGHDRIAGELANLGIAISDRSVGNILAQHGVPTAPERTRRSVQWKAFIAAHWRGLAAIDAFTVPILCFERFKPVWKPAYVFVAIHLATRRISIPTVTLHPDSVVIAQVARSLAMDDGFLHRNGVTHLIHDGDGAFTQTGFTGVLADRDVTCLRIPPRSPNCNAYAERVIQSIQRECTDRLAFVGTRGLHAALHIYVDYYHQRRNHQGLGNRIIDPGPEVGRSDGAIIERSRLGGLLRYYERERAAA